MLRLETKQTQVNAISDNDNKTCSYPLYQNTIKETLSHFPTGHYISLVSAYTPLKYENIGQFSVTYNDITIFSYDGNFTIKNFKELVNIFKTKLTSLSLTDNGHIKIVFASEDDNPDVAKRCSLNLSTTAAWCLGFKNKKNPFSLEGTSTVLLSDYKYPPATIDYLQIICKNLCGTSDSNMTMPTCLGIMHVTDKLSLINPHIAVNHRINEGRVIDIEILDQNNNPFVWGPVYLELFVSEAAEHEKKQGFFRLEKPDAIHLHAPIKMISIPNAFAFEGLYTVKILVEASLTYSVEKDNGRKYSNSFHPSRDPFCQQLIGSILTRSALIGIFDRIHDSIKEKLAPKLKVDSKDLKLFTVRIDNDTIIIETTIGTLVMNDFLQCFYNNDSKNLYEEHTFKPDTSTVIKLKPNILYNEDARLNIYCKEYHNRYPVAVARRIDNYYQIVNQMFWSWHELQKPTNELHFRIEKIVAYPDGTRSKSEWTDDAFIVQLFYK